MYEIQTMMGSILPLVLLDGNINVRIRYRVDYHNYYLDLLFDQNTIIKPRN